MSKGSSKVAGQEQAVIQPKRKRWLPGLILLAGLLVGGGLLFAASRPAEQCPENYTQQQVDTGGCIIGADIGAGLLTMLGIAVGLSAMFVAVILSFVNRGKMEADAMAPAARPLSDSAEQQAKGSNFPHPFLAGVLVIVVFLLSQAAASILVIFLARSTGGYSDTGDLVLFGSPVLLQFAFIFIAEGLVLGFVAWYLRRRGVGRAALGLVRPKWSDIVWAVAAFVVYFMAYAILLQIVSSLVPGFNAEQKQDTGFDGASGLVPLSLVFFALVVLAPVTEETLLRGFFFGSLRRRYKYLVSAIVTSAVFASLHLGGGESGAGLLWVAALDTFVLSLALCYLREKTGRLWASILLHAIKNSIAFLYLFVLASGS